MRSIWNLKNYLKFNKVFFVNLRIKIIKKKLIKSVISTGTASKNICYMFFNTIHNFWMIMNAYKNKLIIS